VVRCKLADTSCEQVNVLLAECHLACVGKAAVQAAAVQLLQLGWEIHHTLCTLAELDTIHAASAPVELSGAVARASCTLMLNCHCRPAASILHKAVRVHQ
jgi:hypothetical protein